MAGLIFLCAAYILSQFYRSFLAVLTPSLTAELAATNADLAFASGAWFFAFALMQFVVGVSLDRFGPRRTAGLLLGVAGGGGVFVFAFAQSPMMITIAMALIGIGCSPVLMASLYIFARTFSVARFALLTSSFVGVGNLGNIIGATPMALASEAFGWRMVVMLIGVITLVVATAIYVMVKDPERRDADSSENSGLSGYLELFRIKALWFIFPAMMLTYSAAAGLRGLWVGPFLADVYLADAALIGQITLFMAIAMTGGNFMYGPLDLVFKTRKWVVAVGCAFAIAGLSFLALAPEAGLVAITVTLVIIGITGTSYGVMMAHGRSFVPTHLTGRGVTLLNFFSIGGVGLMQFLSGSLVGRVNADNAVAQYEFVFGFYAVTLAAALAIYLFSKDAKPKSTHAD